MLQSALLAELAARTDLASVSAPYPAEVDSNANPIIVSGVQWKFCMVLEKSADNRRANRRKEYFYVRDEGQGTESAWYMDKEPNVTLDTETSFAGVALDWIYAQNHANVAELVMVDQSRKKVRAILYKIADASTATKREAIIWKDGANPVQIRFLS